MNLMTSRQIAAKIRGLSTRTAKISDEVHVVACHVAVHAIVHGDVRLATNLVTSLSRGLSRRDLVRWLSQNAPMRWDNKGACFKFQKKRREQFDASNPEELLDMLLNGPKWYDTAPSERQLGPVDVKALLAGILKRADKAREEGREVKHAELLSKVEAILAA